MYKRAGAEFCNLSSYNLLTALPPPASFRCHFRDLSTSVGMGMILQSQGLHVILDDMHHHWALCLGLLSSGGRRLGHLSINSHPAPVGVRG